MDPLGNGLGFKSVVFFSCDTLRPKIKLHRRVLVHPTCSVVS